MFDIALKFIATIIILVGVILVYDARIITNKIFSFGDKNEATSGLKILGWILSIIGILMVFFIK